VSTAAYHTTNTTPTTALPSAAELRRFYMEGGPRWAESACLRPAPVELVDVRKIDRLVVLAAPQWSHSELRFLVRPEVAARLAQAARSLPEDLRIGFWEGYRPLTVQRALWDEGLAYLRQHQPGAAQHELEDALSELVARPGAVPPPHSTGSAVDIAPIDGFGRTLTPDDAWGRMGFDIMAGHLRASGLAGYALEWWHWSYGDHEWAREFDCAPLPFAAREEYDGPGGGI
jgi:D-alanyl-D-alanine dipeptidase